MSTRRLAIIGLGLIGGSLGLALKQARGNEIEIIGYARRDEVASEALRRGAVDRTERHLATAVSETDIVILAVPINATRGILEEIAGHLAQNAIVSDVGSTKVQVLKWAEELLPPAVSFVGGHPMTGKETSGIEEAEEGLFRERIYCLTPGIHASEDAVEAIQEMVKWTGAEPLFIDGERHDVLVAGVSHLPLVLASALVSTLGSDNLWSQMAKLAASGYRDMTRLALGDPKLHVGVCVTNREAVLEWIDRYIDVLNEYRRMIRENPRELESMLDNAQGLRRKWLEEEGYRFNK
ncbi:MAG: prephenate dehydrogenase/arogenate dehydrogenase family protein [Dehalococcoidia bacterium]